MRYLTLMFVLAWVSVGYSQITVEIKEDSLLDDAAIYENIPDAMMGGATTMRMLRYTNERNHLLMRINLENYSRASYILKINKKNQFVKSFKIIKN